MHDNNPETVYLSNSKDLIKLLVDLELIHVYQAVKKVLFNDLVYFDRDLRSYVAQKNSLEDVIDSDEQYVRITRTKEIVHNYATGRGSVYCEFDVEARDIVLPPFNAMLAGYDEDIVQFNMQTVSGTRRNKLEAFLSTPRFVKFLTDISSKLSAMKNITKEEKKMIL